MNKSLIIAVFFYFLFSNFTFAIFPKSEEPLQNPSTTQQTPIVDPKDTKTYWDNVFSGDYKHYYYEKKTQEDNS